MKRRRFIEKTSVAISAASLTGTSADAQENKGGPRPNLLIVHCDELNFRTLGCYRDTLPDDQAFMWGKNAVCDTPHIDTLAAEGSLWTKCYPATPVCSPSRSSLLTGRYPQNTPVTNNNIHLGDDQITFALKLSEAGYHTGYAGKWHLDGYGKPQWEPKRKFGFQDNRFMFNRGHWKQFEDTPEGPRIKARNENGQPCYDVKGADETSFATDWLTTKAINYIDEHKGNPFCYMLSIPDPHGPDTVRAPYDKMFDDKVVKKPRTYDKPHSAFPAWAKAQKRCPFKMASYHGMIKCIDDNVGRLIAHLKKRGIYDNTIFIFTADHGDMRGEHKRQNKGIPYEASAKVPFLIRLPGAIPAGKVIDHTFNTVDFKPSILSLLGVECDPAVEGRDLAAVLRGENPASDAANDITFFRSTSSRKGPGSWVGAVTSRYKLILSPIETPYLFDLENEPDELNNLVEKKEHRDRVKHMARALKKYAEATNDPFLKNEKTAADLERLI